jgi:hypothetical protein
MFFDILPNKNEIKMPIGKGVIWCAWVSQQNNVVGWYYSSVYTGVNLQTAIFVFDLGGCWRYHIITDSDFSFCYKKWMNAMRNIINIVK